MSLLERFIQRRIATSFLAIAVLLVGAVAYFLLPVAPLPQVDFPTIQIVAKLPGASAETMATSVATPLERQLSLIAGITQMTSSSSLGTTNIAVQFDLTRERVRQLEAQLTKKLRDYMAKSLPDFGELSLEKADKE